MSPLPVNLLTSTYPAENSTTIPGELFNSTTTMAPPSARDHPGDISIVVIEYATKNIQTTTTESGWLGINETEWILICAVVIVIISAFLICCLCCSGKKNDEEKKKKAQQKLDPKRRAAAVAAAAAVQEYKNRKDQPPQQLAPAPAKPAERVPDVVKTDTVIERDTKTLPDGRQISSVRVTKTSSTKSKKQCHKNKHHQHVTKLHRQEQSTIVQVDPPMVPVHTPVYAPLPVQTPARVNTPVYTPVPVYTPPVYTPVQQQPPNYGFNSFSQQQSSSQQQPPPSSQQ